LAVEVGEDVRRGHKQMYPPEQSIMPDRPNLGQQRINKQERMMATCNRGLATPHVHFARK